MPETGTGSASPQQAVSQTGQAASQTEHPALAALLKFIAHTNAKEWESACAMTSLEGLRNASLSD